MASPKHDSGYRVLMSDTALVKSLTATLKSYNNGALIGKISGRIDATATTGTYYLLLMKGATLPADGAATFLIAPIKIIHTNGLDSTFDLDFSPDYIKAKSGFSLVLSTSEFTKTLVGTAWMSATVLYK